jgi:hypothetical protein
MSIDNNIYMMLIIIYPSHPIVRETASTQYKTCFIRFALPSDRPLRYSFDAFYSMIRNKNDWCLKSKRRSSNLRIKGVQSLDILYTKRHHTGCFL